MRENHRKIVVTHDVTDHDDESVGKKRGCCDEKCKLTKKHVLGPRRFTTLMNRTQLAVITHYMRYGSNDAYFYQYGIRHYDGVIDGFSRPILYF